MASQYSISMVCLLRPSSFLKRVYLSSLLHRSQEEGRHNLQINLLKSRKFLILWSAQQMLVQNVPRSGFQSRSLIENKQHDTLWSKQNSLNIYFKLSSFPRHSPCHQIIHKPPSRAASEHTRVFAPLAIARRSANPHLSVRWTSRSATVCFQSSPGSARQRFSPTTVRRHSPSCWQKIEREPCGASDPSAAATNPVRLLQQLKK